MSEQRAALGELFALSTRRVLTQQEIDDEYRTAMVAARREHEAAAAEAEAQHAADVAQAKSQHDEKIAQVHATFDRDRATAKRDYEQARNRLIDEADKNEATAVEQLNRKIWLAESVCEGGITELQKKLAALKQIAEDRIHYLTTLRDQAIELLGAFDLKPPTDWSLVDASTVTNEEAAELEASMNATCDEVENNVAMLQSMRVRRWLKLARRYALIGLVVTVAASVAGAVIWSQPALWITAGGLSAVTIALAMTCWLRDRARRRRAGEAFEPIVAALKRAPVVADRGLRLASARLEHHRTLLAQQRDQDISRARSRIEPVREELARRREVVLKQVDDKYQAYLGQTVQTRDNDLRLIADWLTKKQARVTEQRDAQLAAASAQHDDTVRQIEARRAAHGRDLETLWREGVLRATTAMDVAGAADARLFTDWPDASWENWSPPREGASLVRFGDMQVDIGHIGQGLAVDRQSLDVQVRRAPAMLTLPHHGSMLIETDRLGRDDATALLQSVMLRLLTTLQPGRARFTIIDPVGRGQNFAGFMHLADHDEHLVGKRIWTERDHIAQQLANLTEHMENVIQKYLRDEYETIDEYNAQAGELAEPYRFLVVADFPAGFNEESAARLASIVSSGPRCGVYTLIVLDKRQQLPPSVSLEDIESHSVTLDWQDGRFVWKDEVFSHFSLTTDAAPPPARLQQVLHRVGEAAGDFTRVQVPFASIVPDDQAMWSGDSSDELTVPIGRTGATRLQRMTFGRGVAQHALLAGKTGSGKSTLLHVIVTNLSLWYAPDQVEFYLIDFKKGVEFKTYATHHLPHARAVAIESDREFGLSVLQRIDAELRRRGDLFRERNVQDLAGYRRAAPEDVMPRTLLIIDEFQEFFSEDDKVAQDAALLLDRLVRQGRAFGIHVILGTQTLAGAYGLARSTLGQMAVRVALQCSEADSQLILTDNNAAARLLSRPGEAIYNDAGGLVEGNSPFQVAWLDDPQREAQLQRASRMATERSVHVPPAIVFEGNAPAEVERNVALAAALAATEWPAPTAPPTVWLGDPIAIKSPTGATLRRQSAANVLIVGQRDEAAMSMMLTAMVSLAAQHSPQHARFTILDGSPADSSLHGRLARVAEALPHETRIMAWRDAGDSINALHEEMKRRQDTSEENAPAEYLLLYGLQRYRTLARSEDEFSFSMSDDKPAPKPDKQFADLLRDGPPLGMHTIVWCDSVGVLLRMLDRSALREFDARVLFQMSATDSTHLIDSPAAGKLGLHRALFFSEELGVIERFRPYSLPSDAWLNHAVAQVQERGR